ncbi:transposase [Shewanella sp. MBTL60-007]|uniref:REP-associated tyrosine transposase n=1 Tax=Shewanella sp. MBTL60-007 TaxID=2815911 RepID=UPI001BBFC123|nr:transposase [Shewanella sp. MBTL60-007]GIU24636.1 transposase [Shewanella sp. MBTL60-007]
MSWSDLRNGRFSQEGGEYFITFNTDNKREYFSDFNLACLFCLQIAINERKHNCIWLTWVLMPDHFHGLLRLGKNAELSMVVGALKGASSFAINKELKRTGRLWQASFYDHALRLDDDRENISRYIVANPLRKNLVKRIGDYPFWNSIYL